MSRPPQGDDNNGLKQTKRTFSNTAALRSRRCTILMNNHKHDDNMQLLAITRQRHLRLWFLSMMPHQSNMGRRSSVESGNDENGWNMGHLQLRPRRKRQLLSSSLRSNMPWRSWFVQVFVVVLLLLMLSVGHCNKCSSQPPPQLDESSVVLITGAAGFVGSELAMALHRVYQVQHLILMDSMESMSSYGTKLTSVLQKSNTTTSGVRRKTRSELALLELKRQRIFHVLQTLRPSTATFYRADLRPSLPEYFDVGQVPTLDYIFTQFPNITHVVHLADAYHHHSTTTSTRGIGEWSLEPTDPLITQAVPRIKEETKAGMMETLLEQLYKVKRTTTTTSSSTTNDCHDAVPHLVYASSYEVYNHLPHRKSRQNPPPFDEAKPITTPSSLRGASKLMDELLARAYHTNYGIGSIGLRFFCIYGPWGLPGSPLYELAQRAVATKSTTPDDLSMVDQQQQQQHVRDYVYIDDAVDAIMAAMQFRPTVSTPVVINVGTGVGSTLRDIVHIMRNLLPQQQKQQQQQERRNEADNGSSSSKAKDSSNVAPATVSMASTERAKQLLGFQARVTLQEGIAHLLAWHYDRTHPNGDDDDSETLASQSRTRSSNQTYLPGMASCSPLDKECLKGAPVFSCVSECSHPQQCTSSYWDTVARRTRWLTASCDTVLYTVDLSDRLTSIPSAHKAPSYAPGKYCNLAFVSETSPLVRQLKRSSSSSSRLLNWFRPTSRQQNQPLLRHGIWTIVPVVPDPTNPTLALLPKFSPSLFFGSKTRRVIFCEPHVMFTSISSLVEQASMQPYSPNAQGATSMLIGKRQDQQRQRRRLDSYQATSSSSSGIKEAVQQAAYRMTHIAVTPELSRPVPTLLLDSSFLVHTLQNEDSRLFRCDVYGEVVQWEVASNDRPALQLMLSLHDMWSQMLVEHSGGDDGKPWWTSDAVQAVPEKIVRPPLASTSRSRRRRRLQELTVLSSPSDEANRDGTPAQSNGMPTTSSKNTRRLDNAEDLSPMRGEDESDGKRHDLEKDALVVEDGFGVVPHKGDLPEDSGDEKVKALDAPAAEDENDGNSKDDEVDDEDEKKGQAQEDNAKAEDNPDTKDQPPEDVPRDVPKMVLADRDSSDIWMGVISSTPVHYFVRIVPSSAVGAIYLED